MEVYCLKYAESYLPESCVFDGGSSEKAIPIAFVIYLIKDGDRNILVDAGCDTMPGFEMKKYYSPAFILRKMDLLPDDITDVVITHSHHDHIEAVKHFENAILHITKKEYENSKSYIPNDMKLNVFDEEYELGNIKIIKCGGHSEGSAIVEIKADALHILAGDECYTNVNIKDKICTGSYFNKEKSLEFVRKYSDGKYNVHTCHDISLKTERII